MLTLGLRRPITSVLLDFGALTELPNPNTLAEAFAGAVGKKALFSRAACVVQTPEQQRFADTLKHLAGRPDDVAIFPAEETALKWLGIDTARFKR